MQVVLFGNWYRQKGGFYESGSISGIGYYVERYVGYLRCHRSYYAFCNDDGKNETEEGELIVSLVKIMKGDILQKDIALF